MIALLWIANVLVSVLFVAVLLPAAALTGVARVGAEVLKAIGERIAKETRK